MDTDPTAGRKPEVSIILPCLDEEHGIGACLAEIKGAIRRHGLRAEVIVVDNGSTDASAHIVRASMKDFSELRLIVEKDRGYGSACLRGFREARGDFLFIADADLSYDFNDMPRFIEQLKNGADLVVGNRFSGGMHEDAMPFMHRYVGNPFLSMLVKVMFKVKIGDIHCGARAITREAFRKLTLYTQGMEFASELIIKAAKRGYAIAEIPIAYRPRLGASKLQSVGDGWRHLRFILLYSPIYLFFIPGAAIAGIGLLSMLVLYFGKVTLFNIQFYVHPLFLSSLLIMIGYQVMLFAGFSRIYAITHLGETDHFMESLFKKITIEKAGFLGLAAAFAGAIIYLGIFVAWIRSGFGSLDEIKNSIVALTFVVVGVQTFFSAFMLSVLGIKEK